MIEEILTATKVQHRRGRFLNPPVGTYAVFFDDLSADGADPVPTPVAGGIPRIYHHDVRVEVYESEPDDATETSIEAALDAVGVEWTKEDRYWMQDVQRYQVIYEFNYTSKT